MNRSEFIEQYERIVERALRCVNIARSVGILRLEEEIDHEKAKTRDIFEYGLRFVIDDGSRKDELLDKLLSNIVNQEKDEQMRVLKTLQKEAVLMIQMGYSEWTVYSILNSYVDIPINEDRMAEVCDKYMDEWSDYYKKVHKKQATAMEQ